MRKFNALVFDEFIPGTNQVVTSSTLDDRLGGPNTLSLFAVVDNVSGQAPITITVQIQHSADRRNWIPKNANPEINAATINLGATTAIQGFDSSPTSGTFGFVRLAVSLGSNPPPSAHVKIYVTGRDDSGT